MSQFAAILLVLTLGFALSVPATGGMLKDEAHSSRAEIDELTGIAAK